MAAPVAPDARKPAASVWVGPPVPPRPEGPPEPAPPAPPAKPPRRGWHHDHPYLTFAALLAVLAAAVLFLMLAQGEDGPFVGSSDARSRDVEPGSCSAWGHCGPRSIHLSVVEYRNYVEMSVRPTLVSISASFTSAGCTVAGYGGSGGGGGGGSPGLDDKVLGTLRDARDLANRALEQAKAIAAPPVAAEFHASFEAALGSTVATVDAIEECIEGQDDECSKAQTEASRLLTATARLSEESRSLGL